MSLLIADIRHTRKGLDCKTKDIQITDLREPSKCYRNYHCIIITNGKEFKVLKDRSGHKQVNKVYPIKDLIFFVYRHQCDMIEIGSVDASEWIQTLTKFLNSKQLTELSKEFERLAFEKA